MHVDWLHGEEEKGPTSMHVNWLHGGVGGKRLGGGSSASNRLFGASLGSCCQEAESDLSRVGSWSCPEPRPRGVVRSRGRGGDEAEGGLSGAEAEGAVRSRGRGEDEAEGGYSEPRPRGGCPELRPRGRRGRGGLAAIVGREGVRLGSQGRGGEPRPRRLHQSWHGQELPRAKLELGGPRVELELGLGSLHGRVSAALWVQQREIDRGVVPWPREKQSEADAVGTEAEAESGLLETKAEGRRGRGGAGSGRRPRGSRTRESRPRGRAKAEGAVRS